VTSNRFPHFRWETQRQEEGLRSTDYFPKRKGGGGILHWYMGGKKIGPENKEDRAKKHGR